MSSVFNTSLFAEDSPLAGAWLAANAVDKRLSKQSKDKLFSVPISETTRAIEKMTQTNSAGSREAKLPLRLSSQLLYGVVRIYSSRANTLHGEVSHELKQINKVFSVNKNITMDSRELDINDVLKDQMTMENLIDNVNEFNINDVFGETQQWTQEYNTSVSDVDVGRNGMAFSDVELDDNESSLDDIPRRAELERADDTLGGGDELALDLNLEKAATGEDEMDFEVPNFDAGDDDMNVAEDDDFDGGFDMPLEELEEQVENQQQGLQLSSYDDEPIATRKTRRRAAEKITIEYRINNVVRTKSKKLIVDPKIDRSAQDVRNHQLRFETELQMHRLNSVKVGQNDKDDLVLKIFKSLQPDLLNVIGTNWKSLKKQKLQSGNAQITYNEQIEEEEQPLEEPTVPDFEVPEINNDEEADVVVPDLEPSEDVEADNEELESELDDEDDEFELIKTTNKSSVIVANYLRSSSPSSGSVKLDTIIDQNLLSSNKRKNATRTFFELLVLATSDSVKLNQDRLFGEIEIESKSNLFEKFL